MSACRAPPGRRRRETVGATKARATNTRAQELPWQPLPFSPLHRRQWWCCLWRAPPSFSGRSRTCVVRASVPPPGATSVPALAAPLRPPGRSRAAKERGLCATASAQDSRVGTDADSRGRRRRGRRFCRAGRTAILPAARGGARPRRRCCCRPRCPPKRCSDKLTRINC